MPDMVELFVAAPDGSGMGDLLARPPAARGAGDWSWTSALPPDADVTVKSVAFHDRARARSNEALAPRRAAW